MKNIGEITMKIKKSIKYIILITGIIIGVTGMIFLNITREENKKILEDQKIINVTKNMARKSKKSEKYKYILKEYNGKLAIFEKGKKEPKMIFNVLINSLPEVDIKELKKGLKIKNEEELNERIEDFVS